MNYEDWFDDEDEEEGLYPLDLPITDQSFAYEVSQFFIEHDRKEKRVFKDVSRVMDRLYEKHGDSVSFSALSYVSRRQGWDMEILMEKHEVEDYLLQRHNIFDDDIWMKVIGTEAMSDLRREVYKLSQTYLDHAVREVLGTGLPDTAPEDGPHE